MHIVWVFLSLINLAKLEWNTTEHYEKGLIAHGEKFDPEEFPYVVYLAVQLLNGVKLCTGSLLTPTFVLTAAHCTHKQHIINFTVRLPKKDGDIEIRTLKKIYQHKDYETDDLTSDLSVLELEEGFENIAAFAVLSGQPSDFEHNTVLTCTSVGFGSTETGETQIGYKITVAVKYGPDACLYTAANEARIQRTWREFLCSVPNKQMVCPGDSGGPLICNGSVYGVAGHGYNHKDSKGRYVCGSDETQTRHVFVYLFRDWINDIVDPDSNMNTSFRPWPKTIIILFILMFYNFLN